MFDIESYTKDFFKLEINPDLKKNWIEVFNQMAVHTRKRKPEELLTAARPNEEPKITQYRIANYRPITYGVVNKSMDDVYRAVSAVNFSINNLSDKSREYIHKNNFDNYNLETFLQKKVLRRDIEDPNGFLVWLPTGEGISESNKNVSPKPLLVYSSALHYTDFENVFSFLSDEVNPIKVGNNSVNGKVYYILTKTDFYKFVQISHKDKEVYQLNPIYPHNIGELPVIILGGDINDDNYFNSFFSGFLAFGDEAIRQFSDWQATMVTCGFPIKEQFEQDCKIKLHIDRSSNPIPEGEEKFEGVVKTRAESTMHQTPYGTILRQIPSANTAMDDTLDATIPSVRFIAPPIEVAIESKKSWQELRLLAQEDLNQSLSYAGDSGKKVELTNEGKYSMLTKIYNNYFDNIYRKSLIYIECYLSRVLADNVNISINKPETITMTTKQDILNEISVLKSEDAPTMIISERYKQLAQKMFSGNPLAEKTFLIITIIDPLFTLTIDEKTSLQMSNNVSDLAVVTSINAYGVLTEIAYEKTPEWFMKATIAEIITEFNNRIVKYMPEEKTELVDNNGN